MEIRQLQTFRTVVESGSFTQAALQLKYAQSTITAHIQMLEEELEGPLFDRLGKKMVLTNMGKELYPYTVEVLDALLKMKQLSNNRGEIKGCLRIAASETLTVYRLGPLLAEYKRRFPNVNISLTNDNCAKMRKMLHTGEIDLAFVLEPRVNDSELVLHELVEEPVVFIGGMDCSIKRIGKAYKDEIEKECIIFTEDNCALRICFENYLRGNGIAAANIMVLSGMEAIKQCVVSGLGITLIPLVSIENLLIEHKVKKIECEEGAPMFYAQLAYHKNKWISPAQKKFIEIAMVYLGTREKN